MEEELLEELEEEEIEEEPEEEPEMDLILYMDESEIGETPSPHQDVSSPENPGGTSIFPKGITGLLLLIIILMIINTCRGLAKETWEYKIVEVKGTPVEEHWRNVFSLYEADFNAMGRDGWELCSTIPTTATSFPNFGSEEYHVGIKSNTKTDTIYFIFKRKR